MSRRDRHSRHPGKWVTTAYRLLAAGRYAYTWLQEFFILYEEILKEEGEQAAHDWAIRELLLTIKPSVAVRIYRLLRVAYLAWQAYRKLASD
jgi:hypothetical protein